MGTCLIYSMLITLCSDANSSGKDFYFYKGLTLVFHISLFKLVHPEMVDGLVLINCVSTQSTWSEWAQQKVMGMGKYSFILKNGSFLLRKKRRLIYESSLKQKVET